MKTAVGLIGAGMMGVGIAANLVRHGHPLNLLDHPGNQPLDALLAAGARLHPSARAVASEVEVLLVCVTGSPQVEAVLTGPDGALAGLRPGALVVDLSTSIPSSTEKMAAIVQAAGAHFIDAAMTRTPKEAAEGRLNLLVGGEATLLERCRPVLACFAENIFHAGPVGAGHRMKLLHNFVSLGLVTLIAEAAACAQRSQVSAEVFVDVLARGGGGGIALDRLKPYLLEQDIGALRFSVANACKDLGYYQTMAADSGADRTVAHAVLDTLTRAAQAEPESMVPEMVRLIAQR
ncbi:MAG: NAD(P)-dependent oxidoreductase [Betaproteobacteria bacterium]|nr:NAD(P)-dependent oxidoreductase [Betaproteobacteria bacterium]